MDFQVTKCQCDYSGILGRATRAPFPWLGSTSHTCVKVCIRTNHPWLSILTLKHTGVLLESVFCLGVTDLAGRVTPSSALPSLNICLQKVSRSPKLDFKYREVNKTSLTNWQLSFLSDNHRVWRSLQHPEKRWIDSSSADLTTHRANPLPFVAGQRRTN